MNSNFIDDLTRRVGEALPSGAHELKRDIEKNVEAVVRSYLGKLDLVTREEFEVQSQVLARTRAKVEALEKRVTELEAQLLEK